ncbi:MAG: TetR/AcrR family transcriptional regulator [Actinomycetota bacterium]|nr:TetR/AcrR family transcriptional regulator [Actinomycetota bacterium]
MSDEVRPYRMQRRAESQAQTRLRITESAVELHGTLGPSRTSISAVAALAGVRRSTVYRHFPDEAALFDACRAHWSAANPPPDLGAWEKIDSPNERLGVALGELYTFYRLTESMLDNLFRDEKTMPLIQERFAAFRGYLAAARDTLMAERKLKGAARRRTQAALGHAITFSTWKSLVKEQGLTDADAATLLRALVAAAGS